MDKIQLKNWKNRFKIDKNPIKKLYTKQVTHLFKASATISRKRRATCTCLNLNFNKFFKMSLCPIEWLSRCVRPAGYYVPGTGATHAPLHCHYGPIRIAARAVRRRFRSAPAPWPLSFNFKLI